jgi:pimeloyl-ACP methyl ester carboxylesterase
MTRKLVVGLVGFAGIAVIAAIAVRLRMPPQPEIPMPGKFPEQVVYVQARDDVMNAGVLFTPPKSASVPIAIIWVHGWGTNFYNPSYVAIGRALAARGLTTISVNTRMHDVGNVEKYTEFGKRIRGGGYWGVTSEDALDIGAWVDYAERIGFGRVVVVGHSAGWASVAHFQGEAHDPRVVGLVLASGMTGAAGKGDAEMHAHAKKLVAEGSGEELIRLPNPSFPSYVSAATYLDMENTPPAYKDFFGIGHSPSPGVSRVKCPILAFFDTTDDVGGKGDLDAVNASVQRLPGPPRLDTTMIAGGGHEYTGQAAQVADKIARWVDTDVLKR